MSTIRQAPTVRVDMHLFITEPEARALDALVGYGIEPFLKVFYAQMGRHYMKPHEAGLRALFKTIRSEVPQILRRADAAKTAFALHDPVIRSRQDHDELVARIVAQSAIPQARI